MRSRKLVIGFGLLVAVASSVPAYAQPSGAAAATAQYPAACTKVEQADSEKAHKLYEAGKILYDERVLEQAIVQFRDAYKRDCTKHDLLVIISRAYELNRQFAEAIRALELYIEREKPADASTHRTRIEALKKDLAAQPPPVTTAPPPEIREHTLPPWLVVGVGGVAVVTGAILLATAGDFPPGCEGSNETCVKANPLVTADELKTNQDKAGKIKGQRTAGTITLIGGIGIVAGGLLWHFLEPTGPVTTTGSVKPKLTPEVAPGYAGMSVGGTF